jgi:hypothetical protein
MYGSGTYVVVDGTVKILYDELYIMNVMDVNYWPKEGLILTETDGNYEDYSILENYKKLEYVCPPNAFCISLPYIKVQWVLSKKKAVFHYGNGFFLFDWNG